MGRVIFTGGVEVSSIEKRVRGHMAEANDSIRILGMKLTTISTSGEGVAKTYFNPIPGLLMAYRNTLWYLSRCVELNQDEFPPVQLSSYTEELLKVSQYLQLLIISNQTTRVLENYLMSGGNEIKKSC